MAGRPVRKQFLRKCRGHGIALLKAFPSETLKRPKTSSLPQGAVSRRMHVYFPAVALDVPKGLPGVVSTLVAAPAKNDLLSKQIIGRAGHLAGCRLTIRSSRDRFAARLHGDVYHSAVPRSGPA